MTKKAMVERFRGLLASGGPWVPGDEPYDWVVGEMLPRHPDWPDIERRRPVELFVASSSKWKTRCLYVRFEDGSTRDFSFYSCINRRTRSTT